MLRPGLPASRLRSRPAAGIGGRGDRGPDGPRGNCGGARNVLQGGGGTSQPIYPAAAGAEARLRPQAPGPHQVRDAEALH